MSKGTTRQQLDRAMQYTGKRLGIPIDFHVHNQRGYGLLYVPNERAGDTEQRIAGIMWEGINRTTAYHICNAINNLIDLGYVVPTRTQEGADDV